MNEEYATGSGAGNHLALRGVGRIPPQAVREEEAVLGAILLEKGALAKVIDMQPDMFYKDSHAIIFQACLDLDHAGSPTDLVTVSARLSFTGKMDQVGGAHYLSVLTSKVASSANIDYHATIIKQKWVLREIVKRCSIAADKGFDITQDCFDLLDKIQEDLFELGTIVTRGRRFRGLKDFVLSEAERLDARMTKGGAYGLLTQFSAFNEITQGFQKQDLVIIAGRPAMGKTSFAMAMMQFIAGQNIPVAVFSLEMSGNNLAGRMICSRARVNFDSYRSGKLNSYENEKVQSAIGYLHRLPMVIDESGELTIGEFRAKARETVRANGSQAILIDYLQLIHGIKSKNGNREQEIAGIARSLKAVAKELDIPVIALCQLSRAVETRSGEKKPMLSDLRESGAIEQDADMVIFLYRPEYYGCDVDEMGASTHGLCEAIIAKQRNGSNGTVKLAFHAPHQAWGDWDNTIMKYTDYTEPIREEAQENEAPF